MSWQDIGNAISKSAPLLGLAIGGPVGAAVGGAASLLSSAFGGDPQDPKDLLSKIFSDPQKDEKLAKLEADNQQQAVELNKLHFSEMQNARQREIDLAKIQASAGQAIDKTPRQLAIIYTIGYVLAYLSLVVSRILFPQLSIDIAAATAGLGNGEMFILGYYFGSSNKDKKI